MSDDLTATIVTVRQLRHPAPGDEYRLLPQIVAEATYIGYRGWVTRVDENGYSIKVDDHWPLLKPELVTEDFRAEITVNGGTFPAREVITRTHEVYGWDNFDGMRRRVKQDLGVW